MADAPVPDNAECVFCKIAAHQLPGEILYEDELVVAFPDLHPVAKVHILIIPKRHVADLNGVTAQDEQLYGRIVWAASALATKRGTQHGWQLLCRVGKGGGQEVGHVHFHLTSGNRC